MLLVINSNNTNTVFGVFDGEIKRASWRISTDPRRTADEFAVWLSHLMGLKGLKLGVMTSAAPISCGGFEGSYGHETEDARAFAAWGVDYVVYDWCGADKIYTSQNEMQAAYQKMGEALKANGRAIGFVTAQEGAFNVAAWAPKTGANAWRIGKDIEDKWASIIEGGFAYDNAQGAEIGRAHV
mgnify:CR=1 FL=1